MRPRSVCRSLGLLVSLLAASAHSRNGLRSDHRQGKQVAGTTVGNYTQVVGTEGAIPAHC